MGALELLTLTSLIASSVDSELIVNRCCDPAQAYNGILDKCSRARGQLKEAHSSFIAHDEKNSLTLLSGLVKQLDGKNGTKITFKIQSELPEGPCSNGSFITTFCTALDRTHCPKDMTPLVMTTRAQLKINEEYYSPKEFCIIGGDERTLEMRVCNPSCSAEVPCVRKCCDMDQVWDFQNGSLKVRKRCTLSGTQSWRPRFYSSAGSPVPKGKNDQIHPHYFIAHPRSFYIKNKTTIFTHEQRDVTSKKFSWIFHIGFSKNYYKRESRYSWTDSSKFWATSCVDGVVNSVYRGNSEFQGMEEEDVLIEAVPIGTGHATDTGSVGQLIIYGLSMTISGLFILMTLLVHALLWHRQTLHGWTLMSYCASLFLTYAFFVFKFIQAFSTKRDVKAAGLCVFIGVMVNFFYICTFCWLTVQNFDLWLTFRKLQVRSKSSVGVRRYLAYATFALGLPLVFIAIGLALDALYENEPETSWIIPEYGLSQCGPHSELAIWVYQTGPPGILFLFNLIFFVTTVFSIYKTQRGAQLATSSSTRNADVALRIKLFCKLLIAMGVPYIFEFVSSLVEGFSSGHVSWYWIILDLLNVFQGIFIFLIFVCKTETWNALKERYDILKRFDVTSSIATGSSTMETSTQVQINHNART